MTKEELLKVAKPILFNTAMVKAILEGRKTVTRRLINWDIVNRCDMERDGTLLCFEDEYGDHIRPEKLCRYKPGDILYVRETWGCYQETWADASYFLYRADYPEGATTYLYSDGEHVCDLPKWKPSIHMPKEAARIFLKVKDVRVERLQDITEEEAWKEGILSECAKCKSFNSLECQDCANEHEAYYDFMDLWDSTIKKDQLKYYGCEANPYVWVIEFERIEVE